MNIVSELKLTKYPAKGMFIAITKWTSHKDNSWISDVLEVVSADKSLILVKTVCNEGSFGSAPFKLNCNQFNFRLVSDEFVKDLKESLSN